MSRRTAPRARLALLLVLSLAMTPALGADADPRARLARIDADLERLEATLEARRLDREALARDLEESDRAVSGLADAVRTAESDLAAQRARIDGIETRIVELGAQAARQREALVEQLRGTWLLSRRDPLQLLFEAETPDRLGRVMHHHRVLTGARVARLEEWRAVRAELAGQEAELAREALRLRAERDRLAARAGELADVRARQSRLLASLETRIGADEAARAALEADRRRLVELLERLSREAQQPTGEAFSGTRGRLPWPVEPRILAAFGAPPARGRPSADGVLLAADAGTTVRAVAPGEVVFADWMRGYGLMVIVDHGGGFMSLYGRAETLLRVAGDRVEAGEPVATAGRSGGSDASGVWFEIRRRGRPEDPVLWCLARG